MCFELSWLHSSVSLFGETVADGDIYPTLLAAASDGNVENDNVDFDVDDDVMFYILI